MRDFKRIRQDLVDALEHQQFPVRGWHLGIQFGKPGNPYAYPVHSGTEVELDDELLPKEKPPVLFHVEAQEVILTADFRLEANTVLFSQPWACTKEMAEKQWCRFANTDGHLEVILDATKVPPVFGRLLYPKPEAWKDRVNYWTKKWKESDKTDNEARWVLVQLTGIRDSGNHMLHQALGQLAQTIEKTVPDFWWLAELAMMNRLDDEEGRKCLEMCEKTGALTVRYFQRPAGPATETIQ